MLQNGQLYGTIAMQRQEVRPFTDKQIALVQNFAAQAVIAIENARLLNQLRQRTTDLAELLEQQTATSEVLRVISSSPGQLEPVFDAMLENAVRICEAHSGTLVLRVDDGFRVVALHGAPAAFSEARSRQPVIRFEPGHHINRLVQTKGIVHIADLVAEPAAAPHLAKFAGARTLLSVPMLKDNEVIGAFGIYRQEVRPFTDKQIAVVESFAAQAVIAIENTRLLNELRQSLEQQTATAQVLSVISSSPAELDPVFQSMLENATRICEANFGTIYRYDGKLFHTVASRGEPPALVEFRRQRGAFVPVAGQPLDRMLRARAVVQSADDTTQPVMSPAAQLGGARSHLTVPMFKDDDLVGAITLYPREIRPFTEKQVELVQNFAAQAVIAIENTRLLNELRQSLEQQTATSKVLSVISSSPGDLKPVFQTMLENAVHICDAKFGNLWLREGDLFRVVAVHGAPAAYSEMLFRCGHPPWPGNRPRNAAENEAVRPDRRYYQREGLPGTRSAARGHSGAWRRPDAGRGAVTKGRRIDRLDQHLSPRGQALHRKADRASDQFRRPGRYCHRKHATAGTTQLRQRTTDLTELLEQQTATSGSTARHLKLARSVGACVPSDAGKFGSYVPGKVWTTVSL